MFFSLLIVTLLVALATALAVVRLFDRPIDSILQRIVADEIRFGWLRYLKFALFVVGISGGVRIHSLERFVTPTRGPEAEILTLNAARWTLEIFRTLIQTLQSMAWVLLVFFVFALIAYVIVRAVESRRPKVVNVVPKEEG